MGNITIHVPQQIQIEYSVHHRMMTKRLLDVLNALILRVEPDIRQQDRLLGLFENQADELDQITEWAMQTRETAELRVS